MQLLTNFVKDAIQVTKCSEQKSIISGRDDHDKVLNEATLSAGVDLLSVVKASVTGSLFLHDSNKVVYFQAKSSSSFSAVGYQKSNTALH